MYTNYVNFETLELLILPWPFEAPLAMAPLVPLAPLALLLLATIATIPAQWGYLPIGEG